MTRVVTRAVFGDPQPGRTPWAAPAEGLPVAPAPRVTELVLDDGHEPFTGDANGVAWNCEMLEDGAEPTPVAESPDTTVPERITEIGYASVRPVEPLDLSGLRPQQPATAAPLTEWMSPSDLLVDCAYQRDLSDASRKLIARIVEGWDWRRFKPPIVAWTERGFEIIDGQHTAIAAATHPAIDRIPVLVVEAAEVQDRAGAFIGHNRDRLAVTSVQLHHAAVAAGDEDALTVQQVCDRAGVTLLRTVYGNRAYNSGDCMAVGAVAGLVNRRHAAGARRTLEVLVQAERAPITANDIKAAEELLFNENELDLDDLPRAIREAGAAADREAKTYSDTNCVPRWRGLAVVFGQKCRKRRRA